ncbi:MAG: hypothetical protein LBB80_07805 [Treponema sp.]|jgi:hypothetical protein|nr:hypothetical protein [Treponema sp.]
MHKYQGILLIGGICFVLGFLVSETLVITKQDHTCCGEGCPVCLQIQWAQHVFKHVKYALMYHPLPAGTVVPEMLLVSLVLGTLIPLSVVQLKVKMNR